MFKAIRFLMTLGCVCAFTLQAGAQSTAALAQAVGALTGQVSSAEEGNMEGVVVSARKDGASFTVSVVSDNQGRYNFPADRLEPGHYTLDIRAVGYVLDGLDSADVAAGSTASADLRLVPTKNLSAQITNAEWLLSIPGTARQKATLLGCAGCHTYTGRMIGPAVQIIQALYMDNPQALAAYIAAPVKKREDYPQMPPQDYLDPETRLAVAEYMLSVKR